MTTDDSNARGLALFLSDFIVDTGPLHKHDGDVVDEENGNLQNQDNETVGEILGVPRSAQIEVDVTACDGTGSPSG